MTATVHRGTLTPDDRARDPYLYLPVDVGPTTDGLEVHLAYDRSAGVLDLGCFSPEGFRGWSGGARDRFVITPGAATPGYLPGDLEPGTWHVVLGLHRVPVTGLAFEVVATPGRAADVGGPRRPAPPPPARPPARRLPSVDGLAWRAGDLHCHTEHSDGVLTVDELAVLAASRGLDFLAVTDHNTTSHHPLLAAAGRHAGIQLIPGQEVTTAWGHANAFGDVGWVDFRTDAGNWARVVAERGGLLSVNHPLAADCAWRWEVPGRPPLAEVWHSSWMDRRWGGPLAWWQAWDPHVIPVGGSDWHRPGADAEPGSPTTWVACDGDDVLGGLAAGRVSISAATTGPLLLRVGDDLVALDADGSLLTGPDRSRTRVRGDHAVFRATPGPHWLEDGDTQVLSIAA